MTAQEFRECERLSDLGAHLLQGLKADNPSIKQWALELALMELMGQEDFNKLKNELSWEAGDAP